MRTVFLSTLGMLVLFASPVLARSTYPNAENEATIAQLQAEMARGTLTSETLTNEYIARIFAMDQNGPGVNSIVELNPDAITMARRADSLRRKGIVLGPMHGIPVVLKDNIDTGDLMQTSAGSLALVGSPAVADSTVAAKLRAGGAVILGKANMSEWAYFRGFGATSGWSARGGQTNCPYGINRNPSGSSAGPAAAVSANFATVALGTETDGSLVSPGSVNGVVAIKPTVGLTSRAGVVPVSHTQDSVGVFGKTVADAAIALSVIQSPTFDGRDPATAGVPLGWTGRSRPSNIPSDYSKFVDPHGLAGATIGITRARLSGPQSQLDSFEEAVSALSAAGAKVIDLDAAGVTFSQGGGELLVLLFDFRNDVQKYLSSRVGVPVAGGTLQSVVDFDNAFAAAEMPYFGQEIFEWALSLGSGVNDIQPDFGMSYNDALAIGISDGQFGIDAVMSRFGLDAIVSGTNGVTNVTDLFYGDAATYLTSGMAATEGYPIVQVPAGLVDGLPVGVSFFGTAFSEAKLIKLASGFEAVTHVRRDNVPTFAPMTPYNHIAGTLLQPPGVKGVHSKLDRSSAIGRMQHSIHF